VGQTNQVDDRLTDAERYARNVQYFDAFISLVGAVRELKREHGSTAHMAATVDPGLLGRVTELERLTGVLVKSVGAWASSPQSRAVGQAPSATSPDREDRPATYGPVPATYGRVSPAWATECVARELYGNHDHTWVEDAAIEYVHGEPTLRVQVSGVLYRFHAPDVLSNKGDV
jgi:hypothetical protein